MSAAPPVTEAALIDGAASPPALRQRVAAAVTALRREHGVTPGLAAVLVGDDPASQVYVRSKARACTAAGIARSSTGSGRHQPGRVLDLVARLNADERSTASWCSCRCRAHRPAGDIGALDPAKDVDGFHPINVGRLWSGEPGLVPCTPQGVMLLLDSVRPTSPGLDAVVLGRSQIVGRPVAASAARGRLHRHAGAFQHPRPGRDLPPRRYPGRGDRPAGNGDGDWIKPGATVIDVGINRIAAPRAARGSSAMSISRRPAASPARSRRCRAASAR